MTYKPTPKGKCCFCDRTIYRDDPHFDNKGVLTCSLCEEHRVLHVYVKKHQELHEVAVPGKLHERAGMTIEAEKHSVICLKCGWQDVGHYTRAFTQR